MIQINNVSLSYDGKVILKDFSFTLPSKGIVCILGPSGCGKTSLARIIARLTPPDSGFISGIAPGDTAFMFQEDRLFPWLTVLDNIAAVSDKATALRLLDNVGLGGEAGAYPSSLSGGMRRRLALARALAYDARLLILDEPFTGVDNNLKSSLYPLIVNYSEHTPVIVITHDHNEISALGGSILDFRQFT